MRSGGRWTHSASDRIGDESVDEVLRLKYRYLDMRGERMQRNLRLNHTIINAIRREMDSLGFRSDRGRERGRGAPPEVPLPRHARRAHAAEPAPQPHDHQCDPAGDGLTRLPI